MTPVISVIVPIYNQEKYIEQCLVSLFEQASDKVEYILINDGSTDCSLELCRRVISRYNANVRLVNQNNQGLIKTRSIGLGYSHGYYIVSVDSDDILLPGAIPILLKLIDEYNPDIICYNATNNLETNEPVFAYPFESKTVFSGKSKYELYRLLCGTDKLNNIWAKCVRRTLFENAEVYKDIEGISNGEDLYQSLVLIDQAKNVLYVDKILYYWRLTAGSMSRKYNSKSLLSEEKVFIRRICYAHKWEREKSNELEESAKQWVCKILRDITRKAFVSDEKWSYIKTEIKKLRSNEFYQTYYYNTNKYRDKRDLVLKSPFPIMRIIRVLYKPLRKDQA